MTGSFRKHGNRFQAAIQINGKRQIKSFKTEDEAKQWLQATSQQRIMPLCKVLWLYLGEFSLKNKSNRHIANRIRSFIRNFPHLSTKNIGDITRKDILEWQKYRQQKVSNASINREMSILSAACRWVIYQQDWDITNPFQGIKQLKSPPARDKRISQELETQILASLDYQPGQIPTLKKQLVGLFFCLALETAMRLGEICKLNFNLVYDHYLTLPKTKNGDTRNVPLSTQARKLIADYQKAHLDINMETASALFRKYLRKIGIRDLHFHDTRHEAITRLAQCLQPLDLARMTGHRDLKHLMIYYNATPDEIALRINTAKSNVLTALPD